MPIVLGRPPVETTNMDSPVWRNWFGKLWKRVDDQGLWTPIWTGRTIGGTGATVNDYGQWNRIGNLMYFRGVAIASSTATQALTFPTTTISLPFTQADEAITQGTYSQLSLTDIFTSDGTSRGNTIILYNLTFNPANAGVMYPPTFTSSAGTHIAFSGFYRTGN